VIEHFEERLDEFADMMYEQTHVEMSDADLDSISPEYLVHANAIMRETRRKLKWTYRAPHHPRRSLIVAGPRPTVSSRAGPQFPHPPGPPPAAYAFFQPVQAPARKFFEFLQATPARRAACYIWFNL
jgi:hypothetical protein